MKKRTTKTPKLIVALDLSGESIQALLVRTGAKESCIEDYARIEVPRQIQSSTELLELALTSLKGTLLRKARNIVVGISARDCRIYLRDLPAGDRADLRRVIRKAPVQIFQEDLHDMSLDCFRLCSARDSQPVQEKRRKTLITAIPHEKTEALQQCAAKHKCDLMTVTVSDISAIEAIADSVGGSEECTGTLSINNGNATLSIIQNGELAFVRSSFETSFKLADGSPAAAQHPANQIAGLASLATEVRSSLDFFEHNSGLLPSVIYVTGAAAAHQAVLDYLQQELGINLKAFASPSAIRIKPAGQVGDDVRASLSALVPAITEAKRILASKDGLNLLAEKNELDIQETPSVRGTVLFALAIVAVMTAWGGFAYKRVGDLQDKVNKTGSIENNIKGDAHAATTLAREVGEVKESLRAIESQTRARFLHAPVLSAMQKVSLNNFELLKLRIQEDVLQTPVSRAYTNQNRKAISAAPARTVMRNTIVLEARQTKPVPVEELLSSMERQAWFKKNLRRSDPILLKEMISQNVAGSRETLVRVEAYAEKDLQ